MLIPPQKHRIAHNIRPSGPAKPTPFLGELNPTHLTKMVTPPLQSTHMPLLTLQKAPILRDSKGLSQCIEITHCSIISHLSQIVYEIRALNPPNHLRNTGGEPQILYELRVVTPENRNLNSSQISI